MPALLQQVALISESNQVGMGDVMKVAAALQKQASRDIAPIWEISATVDAFETLEHFPLRTKHILRGPDSWRTRRV